MFRPVTKLGDPDQLAGRIPELLRDALRAAMSGRRGPGARGVPRDVLNDAARPAGPLRPSLPAPCTAAAAPRRHPRGGASASRGRAAPHARGRRRTWAGAGELVVRLGEQYGIPMITAYGRNDAVPNAHPLYVGPLGRAGVARGGRGVPARRRARGHRLAARAVHHALRRPLHPRRRRRIIQIDVEGATSAATTRWPSASRPTRARRAWRCWRRWAREGAARRGGVAAEAEALRAQRQARLAAEARWTPAAQAAARVRGAAPRAAAGDDRGARRRRRAGLRIRPPGASPGPARSSPRSTSAGSASRSRSRSAPSSAGRRRRCSPSTATAASS